MNVPCECCEKSHGTSLVVLTGGPGAGKTSVLELVRRSFCEHIAVLPEAAGIVFSGGFPRREDDVGRRAVQRAIYYVQSELEGLYLKDGNVAVALCDRGTVDGAAYWPGEADSYWRELGTTREQQLAKYAAVIHLRTPTAERGYNHNNPVRVESAVEAAVIDERIAHAWDGHPKRFFVDNTGLFLRKAGRALTLLRQQVPSCCRHHRVPEVDEACAEET